jgi:hypothetical protein
VPLWLVQALLLGRGGPGGLQQVLQLVLALVPGPEQQHMLEQVHGLELWPLLVLVTSLGGLMLVQQLWLVQATPGSPTRTPLTLLRLRQQLVAVSRAWLQPPPWLRLSPAQVQQLWLLPSLVGPSLSWQL